MKSLSLFIYLLLPGIVFSQSDTRLVGPTAENFRNDFYYDPQANAFHLIMESVSCLSWSPDSRQLLVTLHYAGTRAAGAPPSAVKKGLPYLNYTPSDPAFALLLINADSHEIVSIKLPFTSARCPNCVSWWDDRSIVLIGGVTNGILVASTLDHPRLDKFALTRVNLAGNSFEQIPFPPSVWQLLDENCDNVDFGETVRVHSGLSLVYVSYWQCQAGGGRPGVIFFDPHGDRMGTDEWLDGNGLRNAVQLPAGFAAGKKYWNVTRNRTSATPAAISKWSRAGYDEALALDGKLAKVRIIPKPRVENGQQIVDMTGPEAFLSITKAKK